MVSRSFAHYSKKKKKTQDKKTIEREEKILSSIDHLAIEFHTEDQS